MGKATALRLQVCQDFKGEDMRRIGIGCLIILALLSWGHGAWAGVPAEVQEAIDFMAGVPITNTPPLLATYGYSVVMESADVDTGGTCEIGIYISNDDFLRHYNVPLIIREVDPGSYMTALEAHYNGNSRVNGFMNGIYDTIAFLPPLIQTRPELDVMSSERQSTLCFGRIGDLDYQSPDGIMFTRWAFEAGNELPPGSDGEPGSGSASITIRITANTVPGRFEIDTACFSPTNHLFMIAGVRGWQAPSWNIIPSFTKSTITIKGERPPEMDIPDDLPTGQDPVVVDEPTEDPSDDQVIDDPQPFDPGGENLPEPFDDPAESIPIKSQDSQRATTNIKPPNEPQRPATTGSTSTTYSARPGIYNYPNPFNAETVIRYTVNDHSWVVITVHDLLGRTVVTLQDWYQAPGEYEVVWDGHDSDGNQVPSGMYFYRSKMRGTVTTGKMVLLK